MTLKVDSYRFGEVNIDGQVFRKDVIIFPKRVFPNWRRATGHSLCMEDLSSVLKDPPKVLILGQGAYARMEMPRTVQEQLEANGVRSSAGQRKKLANFITNCVMKSAW